MCQFVNSCHAKIISNFVASVASRVHPPEPELTSSGQCCLIRLVHSTLGATLINESIDQLPLTALVPETAAEPIVIYDQHAALRIGIVERAGVSRLGQEWDTPGNYILLDDKDTDGNFGVYVGKAAPGGVRNRLMDHIRKKDHWSRAIIIKRDTTFGLNSAQVGWLEGRLWDLIDASEFARLHNNLRPMDETLPAYDRNMLEQAILPVQRTLRLIGYDVSPADDVVETPLANSNTRVQPTGKKYYGVKVQQLLDAGYLTPGTKLQSTSSIWTATATVQANGSIEYNGKIYDSLSAAGGAVKNSDSTGVAGWSFWAVEEPNGIVPLATIRQRYLHDLDASKS